MAVPPPDVLLFPVYELCKMWFVYETDLLIMRREYVPG